MTILETERLIIREFTLEDYNDLNQMNTDPEVCKYILGRPFTPDENKKFLESYLEFYKKKTGQGTFVVTTKDNEFLGWVCLRPLTIQGKEEIEVGYRLNQKSWGKGYATEASQAMVEYGFQKLKLKEIMAIVNPGNKASQNVLAKSRLEYIKDVTDTFGGQKMTIQYWLSSHQ